MSKVISVGGQNLTETIDKQIIKFLTALKNIKKRDNQTESFDSEKLVKSIRVAFKSGGINNSQLERRVIERVIGRLEEKYDGHTTPTSSDVRETVALTLIDYNLSHIAKRYMAYRQLKEALTKSGEPVYGHGIKVDRRYTKPGTHPYDDMVWEKRDARITNEKGKVIFEQTGVEVPSSFSQTATNIVVQKYFRGKLGTPERETSVKQMVDRVARTIANWGRAGGYFDTAADADTFEAELTAILARQMAAFNSPVWFNVGINPQPQCSACFINSVQDDMRSILNLAVTEGMLFKFGSGTGSNLSSLRSSKENLGGSSGKSSGPVSFMKGFDAFAGVIKSGGKTRRAAKMVILDVQHPDIKEFIWCKAKEEKKAWALMDAGYDGSIIGEAYQSIFFQNANNSIRVTDDFMEAAVEGRNWQTKAVTTGEVVEEIPAKEILRDAAEATWICGDPGMQYDTTINRWNPCITSARINASNPCSEYMFLDDTACNLASLNLMKFRRADNSFDVESFKHASRIVITAMEILVGNSSYPTPAIEQNSHDFRPLGIGYANLGALLMSRGLAYDSDEGRQFAAAITALLSGEAYLQSSKVADRIGAFRYWNTNRDAFLRVLGMHRDAAAQIPPQSVPADLLAAARESWVRTVEEASKHGVRNAQISVLAPTGTIAFLMDCDTTGIEPDIALVKYKWLVGGGMIKIVNQTVPEALKNLEYTESEIRDILAYVDQHDMIEGAPHLKDAHVSVFDCAFKAQKGTRSISYMGHLRMMAAVQPFISGAISKTVNLPTEATVEDVMDAYIEAWRLGLKAVAIYRDGSKRQQPLTTSLDKDQSKQGKEKAAAAAPATAPVAVVTPEVYTPRRRRLPDERRSITHKFSVGGHEGFVTVGLYDDGTPGEMFIQMSKEGSTISGLMDSFATTVSIGLQYGVPLKVLVNKFVHQRFEPSGYTNNPKIRIAKSLVDYVFRWVATKFLPVEDQRAVGVQVEEVPDALTAVAPALPVAAAVEAPVSTAQSTIFQAPAAAATERAANDLTMTFNNSADAPTCHACGSMMVRNAACYKCLNCGETSGCS